MEIYNGVSEIKRVIKDSVVTIGNFDGLHIGHREIITRVIDRAKQTGGPSIVMTFHPHPRKVLQPEKNLKNIFPKEDLEIELAKLGLDILIFEPFSRELSQLSAEEFIQSRIYKPLSPNTLIVGYDFGFGANRQGNLEKLKELTDRLRVHLEIVPPVKVDHVIASSTQIRRALANGEVELAAKMLNRPFYLKGLVEKGKSRGRLLGFPTANLVSHAETIPKLGVYATHTLVRGQRLPSVTNVGFNPTFKDGPLTVRVETHILDFNESIYGEEITVQFDRFIRDELRFNSPEELKKQIETDVQMARRLAHE